MPFQLSAPPLLSEEEDREGAAADPGSPGSSYFGDLPEAADLYEIEGSAGDLLLLATDGVFDNLWPEDVERVVAGALEEFSVVEAKSKAPLFK